MNFGPILERSIDEVIDRAKAIASASSFAEAAGDYGDVWEWLLSEIVPEVVPADEGGTAALPQDTPELLGYVIDLDSLYPMKAVTPGWFIGEAAYRAVADAVLVRLESA